MTAEETTHRGVRWRREPGGPTSFYDDDGGRWIEWRPGVDAPPRPPGWQAPEGVWRVRRPRWLSPWRLVPLAIAVFIVVVAVLQVTRPSGSAAKKEATASAALLGKCLAQHGTAEGHPKYSTTPVPCSSPQAAVKVVEVVPTTPGSPLCPSGTTPVEMTYLGVRYPHVECLRPVHHGP